MQDLRISIVQSGLFWEDPEKNRVAFDASLAGLSGRTDLVVLPEMFTTGFSMNAASLAEEQDGPTWHWLQTRSKELDAVVTGSYIVREGEHYYNRLIWMHPDGSHRKYDKRHLFTLAGEHATYTPGTQKLIAEWKGWKICPLICYDLRFPVWSRNAEDYDLLIYVANWPETRRHHWIQLLMARAIENQVYVAGVNRIGTDEKGLSYTGDSMIVDYSGQTMYQCSGSPDVFTCVLQQEAMAGYRSKLQFLPDRDRFEIF